MKHIILCRDLNRKHVITQLASSISPMKSAVRENTLLMGCEELYLLHIAFSRSFDLRNATIECIFNDCRETILQNLRLIPAEASPKYWPGDVTPFHNQTLSCQYLVRYVLF